MQKLPRSVTVDGVPTADTGHVLSGIKIRRILAIVLITAALGLSMMGGIPVIASVDSFAIIGTGRVGSSLGKRFTQLGHDVVYGSRDPSRESVQTLIAETRGDARATSPAEAVVVKALTLVPAEHMLDPTYMDFDFILPIAGDDADAKAKVAELLASMGIEVVDFGKARQAPR